jgi:hypothetical protein
MGMDISGEGKIGIGLTLVFALGAGAYMRYPDQTWLGTATMIIAAGGLVLLIIHHFWTRSQKEKRPSVHVAMARPVLSADGSTLLDPGYIVKLCKEKTDFQINALLAPYVGKVLTISGHIGYMTDINHGNGRLEVWVDIECSDDVKIQARFSANDKTALTQIAKGISVTVHGQVAALYFSRLVIIDCRLLQIAQF